MSKKVMLILCDGMRPDSLSACGHPFVSKFISEGFCSLTSQTVMPSYTLPCHMSLMHSVVPDRHGTVTNSYKPMTRPILGLFDQLHKFGRRCAFIYNWEQLRDLSRPGALALSHFISCDEIGINPAHQQVLNAALSEIPKYQPDFAFVYFGIPDLTGHDHGWMGEAYLDAVHKSWDAIEALDAAFGDEYTIIVTADHGGLNRDHGGPSPEEMTIPILCKGPDFKKGKTFEDASIIDIAPTITKIMGVPSAKGWEGNSIL